MSAPPELETLAEIQEELRLARMVTEPDTDFVKEPEEMTPRPNVRRTFSLRPQQKPPFSRSWDQPKPVRRMSHGTDMPRGEFHEYLVEVDAVMKKLLEQEDTDNDNQISITDHGPKSIQLELLNGHGKTGEVRGTYMLSNLLQELALAQEQGLQHIVISEARLAENPINRLSRMIRDTFWDNLTRRIDADGLERILSDPKNRSSYNRQVLYVPAGEPEMIKYYRRVAEERPGLRLEVEVLPETFSPEYVRDLNRRPGLLAIAMESRPDEETGLIDMKGIPFVVPGARFNELYNWDSYFIALGLLEDGRVDLAKGAVDHFIFEIKHYGKIMNGNRTYYLLRSQPPFLTDFSRRIYEYLMKESPDKAQEHRSWLHTALSAAIKEYFTVWMSEPRYDPETGLSRYHPEGLGVPPETEASHFTTLLRPYADKYGCSVNEFTRMYNYQKVSEPELDEYFRHDRAVRESGHDTSYRVERRCANLVTIDLQALLFKYEMDLGELIRDVYDDNFILSEDFDMHAHAGIAQRRSIDAPLQSQEWFARAEFRRQQVDTYLWNDGRSLYFDYDIIEKEQSLYESVTTFWTMWSGMASEQQAANMVRHSLRKFEVTGGLVSGTEESRGPVSLSRPNRQWDYPYAWPPHQMLAWEGLRKYGYMEDARRLAYRWIFMMTIAFVDFNGVVPEKFDAVTLSHLVNAEYGNQGLGFAYVPKEGFGWMNASFQVGLTYLDSHMRKAVAVCQHPDALFQTRRRNSYFKELLRS
ncbi:unnamed protein product [Malassezia sympodialis ATCC 42132]|uniref:Trehalase n=1 Tax=Malassezia sympodialis (strain ATCC 42132) TaxID=1230383 RepID=M5E9V5_MALS4|nr:uncharacterized protein MSY001_1688 [Malassezia sympodialis ATCC 42132]CCU98982.1 unnamed protein product [Malassezia sympodialis ATCC 42132]SHO79708.1 Similar to S.cerevisiae protein NTH1 (Neutral trehalase, degrades trehalose) [Malassezia sympodialis ATCC 42132]|eukprot:XP_018740253.1 uncharacterized protein MSY001_1688 [Malassezia sympodialis ATCC 42132]